jgi:hypothetical protein
MADSNPNPNPDLARIIIEGSAMKSLDTIGMVDRDEKKEVKEMKEEEEVDVQGASTGATDETQTKSPSPSPFRINDIPPELLIQIFLSLHASLPSPTDVSLTVSWVCNHWRTIALSTPSLWSTIVLNPTSTIHLSRASTFLSRSKSALIDLDMSRGALDVDENGKPVVPKVVEEMLVSGRCKVLKMAMGRGQRWYGEIVRMTRRELTELKLADMRVPRDANGPYPFISLDSDPSIAPPTSTATSDPNTNPDSSDLNDIFPKLRSLELMYTPLIWPANIVKNLTSLKFFLSTGGGPMGSQLLRALKECPNLVVLHSAAVCRNGIVEPWEPFTVDLLHLEEWEIADTPYFVATSLLQYIRTPNLQNLTLRRFSTDIFDHFEVADTQLPHIGKELRKVTLDDEELLAVAAFNILRQLREVREVCLRAHGTTSAILRAMARNLGVMPRLEKVTVVSAPVSYEKEMEYLVEERKKIGCDVETVVITAQPTRAANPTLEGFLRQRIIMNQLPIMIPNTA